MYQILVAPPNNPEIIEGIGKGIYKITGGVIRDANSGQIIAHMREVGEISIQSLSATAGSIFPYLNIGIGVLTLATVAASTFYLNKQISGLSDKLDRIFEEIRNIRQDVELIKAIEVFKDLKTGLIFSDENIKDPGLKKNFLLERVKSFGNAIAVLDTYLSYAETKLFNGKNPEVVTEPLKLYMLAYTGYCNTLLELEEIDRAKLEYDKAYQRIKSVYMDTLYQSLPSKIEIFKPLKIDAERFWGYKKETETIKKLGISFSEWKDLTEGKENGLYIIKVK